MFCFILKIIKKRIKITVGKIKILTDDYFLLKIFLIFSRFDAFIMLFYRTSPSLQHRRQIP